jgi:hypothetical protein
LTSSNDATKASDWYDENLSEKNLIVLTLVAALTGPNFPGALGFFWMKD